VNFSAVVGAPARGVRNVLFLKGIYVYRFHPDKTLDNPERIVCEKRINDIKSLQDFALVSHDPCYKYKIPSGFFVAAVELGIL
jgi:hypothetical protein